MRLHIRSPKDFWSGLIFVSVGIAAVVLGRDYERGSAGMMGPGYFPTALGALLALIGGVAVARSFVMRGEAIGRFALGKAFLILAAVVLFAVLIRGAGLAPTLVVLTLVAGCANPVPRHAQYAALAIGMAVFCVVVFVYALGLPVQAFGTWFSSR